MPASSIKLPAVARDFLRSERGRWHKPIVSLLHKWMQRRDLTLATLRPRHIQDFLGLPSRRPISKSTEKHYSYMVHGYLEWLFVHGLLSFEPNACMARFHRTTDAQSTTDRSASRRTTRKSPRLATQPSLPELAERFIQSLAVTLKPSTCKGYRTSLRDFHRWLDQNQFPLQTLDRCQVAAWLGQLQRRGLHPSTRLHMTQQLRVYLRWLHEQGAISQHPEHLVRRTDMPRLPTYLPRPLPPQADHLLQRRLARSDCPYRLGLLLMRNTGLRVGELRSLSLDCLRADEQDNQFLKVPLGKLNSERLVPLDKKTVRLVKRLQRKGRRKRTWLLEAPPGKNTPYVNYNHILRTACEGLDIPDPINTHRLRHTYATSLINAGMSLYAVMKLLGHRDYRMTLRYAAITQQTVRKEYERALDELQAKYKLDISTKTRKSPDPLKMLSDVTRWLQKARVRDDDADRQIRLLIRRLGRIRKDLSRLQRHQQP